MPPLDLLVAVVQLKALTSGGPSLSQVPNLVTRTVYSFSTPYVHVCTHRGPGTWPGPQGASLVDELVTTHSCASLRALGRLPSTRDT